MNSPFLRNGPGIRWLRHLVLVALAALLVACASSPSSPTAASGSASSSSRYHMDKDAYPDEDVDVSHVPDAVPRYEPKSRGGNKSPYTVWGKEYFVMASAKGYKERGIASWYGKKFHGYATSNGEIYSMYGMTAAHRSLPIPSYAKVTNLSNGRSVIVRVNDRGPFHGGRLIDLSYAAAKKLGYVNKGTAYVEVEAIHLEPGQEYKPSVQQAPAPVAPLREAAAPGPAVPSPVPPATPVSGEGTGWFIQVGAFASADSAHRLKEQISRAVTAPVLVRRTGEKGAALHRVQVGPFLSESEALQLKQSVEEAAATKGMIIRTPVAAEVAG